RDVRAGYVSTDRARRGYGVVLTAPGHLDLAATETQRARLKGERRRWAVSADERDPYEGTRGRHRVLRMSPALARELAVAPDDRIEMLGRHPAPLRAWVRVDAAASGESVGLDERGRRILGISVGDAVQIRRLTAPRRD